MQIKMRNVLAANNGKGGVLIEGDHYVDIDGLTTYGNKMDGFKITTHPQIDIQPEQIGLPPGTDPELISEAIRAISSNVTSNPDEASNVLSRTRLGKWIVQEGLNMMSIAANIITILGQFPPKS